MNKIIHGIIVFLLCNSIAVGQKVHLKTGNFSIKNIDIELADKTMNVERVYNSTSKYKSIFGLGWAYEYSKVLVVNPDGSLVTKECECEGRTDNVYNPTSFDETAKSTSIDKIAEAVLKKMPMNPEELFKFKTKLATDRSFFIDEWKKLLDENKIEPYNVPVGTKFISKSWGFSVITKTQEGYEMTSGNKKKYYNNNGKILKEENGSNWLHFTYNNKDQLIEIGNNLKMKLKFQYNSSGFVSEIKSESSNSFTASYIYTGETLIQVKSSYQNINFKYNYNNNKNQLLTEAIENKIVKFTVVYSNEPENKVEYLKAKSDSFAYIYSRKTINVGEYMRVGSEINYRKNTLYEDYDEDENDDSNKNISWIKHKEKKVIYYINTLSDGFHYNYRTITSDGRKTEDVYNNEEGDPDKIIEKGDTTFFAYNRFGNIIYKESSDKLEEIEYDESCLKLTQIKKLEKSTKELSWSKFTYTKQCDVETVENSKGDKIRLFYNERGKIFSMTDLNENKTLSFKYNDLGKPIKIDSPEGGITVTYDKYGQIDKVTSEQGHKMALQVTQMFQKLLGLVKVDNLIPCKCRL
jgi:YD repeat-containing protein